MSLVVREGTILELENASNIKELLDEYAEESAIGGLPHPSAKVETYRNLERANAIHVLVALVDEVLAGFFIVLSPVLPHYSVRVAVGESFFVAKAYRKSGAGLRLLREAEDYSKEAGCCGLLISAPFEGNLAEVLPHVGYTETNRVFFRSLDGE